VFPIPSSMIDVGRNAEYRRWNGTAVSKKKDGMVGIQTMIKKNKKRKEI
jgi:hypothetical protein